MIKRDDFLLIGSTGRNTGKTEFACQIINNYKSTHNIIGIKITAINMNVSECPRGNKDCGVCGSLLNDYDIIEEKNSTLDKDTSKMLNAGATKVYWLKVDSIKLKKGVDELLKIIPENSMTICESNSVRKVIEPSLYIVINEVENNSIRQSCLETMHYADKIIKSENKTWDYQPERVLIKNNKWIIKEKATAIILAGGKNLRMQGRDKGLLSIRGMPMIQHIINQIEGHFDEIIIGSNNTDQYKFLKYKIVPDIEKNKGPLMGILSCLKESSNDVNFIVSCDTPELDTKFIKEMIKKSDNTDIVMPVSEQDKYEPLYAIYKKSVINSAEILLKSNIRKIIELRKQVNIKFVELPETVKLFNINNLQDYQEYISQL